MPQTIPTPPLGKSITLEDGRRVISRPRSGGRGGLEPVVLPPVGGVGDAISMWGQAEIRNGPGKCQVAGCGCGLNHFAARNKITQLGLQHIMNRAFRGIVDAASDDQDVEAAFATNSGARSYIRVGTGGGATVQGTVGLTTPVATNPTATVATGISLSLGVQSLSFTATWNAGVIAAVTVTEIGIFGLLNDGLNETPSTVTGNAGGNASALVLFARLSEADGEFTSFVINTAAPLSIQYTVSLAFV